MNAESSSTRLSLISRIRDDDSQAWQQLVDLYTPLVSFWCKKQGLGNSDVSDVVQEVFFTVCRKLDSYSPNRSDSCFRAWLWTVTRNKIIDAMRKSQRLPDARGGSTALQAVQQIPVSLDEDEPSQRIASAKLMRRALRQVESEFEQKTWQAFCRSTVDGVSTQVVADELGITAATVRKYRSRVLRRLREQLGEVV